MNPGIIRKPLKEFACRDGSGVSPADVFHIRNFRFQQFRIIIPERQSDQPLLHGKTGSDQLIEDLIYAKKGLSPDARRRVQVTTALSMVAAVKEHAAQGRRIAEHCDVVMVNIHPFFAPAPVEEAVHANLGGSHRRLTELYAATGKRIVIGEIGWPSNGDRQAAAEASGGAMRDNSIRKPRGQGKRPLRLDRPPPV